MHVIVNTSPLIALERIECLDILPKLFGAVVRPQAVLDELMAGRSVYGGADCLFQADWLKTLDNPPEMILRKELGAGETAVIALAVKIQADLVVLDDLAARNVATELGLKVTGTLGLLLAAKQKGLIQNLDAKLNDLANSSFRVSNKLMRILLDG